MNGHKVELSGDKVRLGRETDNDIVIETDGVSRYHAELINKGGERWALKDLGSTNGSKVNSKIIPEERLLQEGDTVTLGDQDFRFGEYKKNNESKNVPSGIPIIESGKKDNNISTVKKIVFQPLPDKNDKPVVDKKDNGPEPIIQTVKKEPVIFNGKEEKKEKTILTAKELSESAANIFGPSEDENVKRNNKTEPEIKKHLLNIVFYVTLLVAVVVFVFLFLNSNKQPKSINVSHSVQEKKIPLVLNYIKSKITNDNVFRFSLLVEDNVATFTIDDLKSDRHYNKIIKDIKPEFLKMLKNSIEGSGFMELDPVSSGSVVNNQDQTRVMTIALNNQYNSITIKNNAAPRSFENIEDAIEDFVDGYDLLTFAMTPVELKKRAELSFAKAEQYYANRLADSSNLLKAELRYKMTVDYLDQFTPKPEIWEIAKKRLDEVKNLRNKRWQELNYEFERLERLAKLKDALEVLEEMKGLAPIDSNAYKRTRLKMTRLSERLKERKK
jgi:pSer/pThr/pTyr-binding forkhead associated (FHA) protein